MTAIHDGDVTEPSVRLRTVLGLLRILAGRRGWSEVVWSGSGFVYVLNVSRTGNPVPLEVDIDGDPGAGGLSVPDAQEAAARAELIVALLEEDEP